MDVLVAGYEEELAEDPPLDLGVVSALQARIATLDPAVLHMRRALVGEDFGQLKTCLAAMCRRMSLAAWREYLAKSRTALPDNPPACPGD